MSPNATVPPTTETTRTDLRDKFNTGLYYERVQRGELLARIVETKHPSRQRAHQPHCMTSQVVEYTDEHGSLVAVVHQYELPWGGLGASGRPEPKMLLWQGVLFGRGRLVPAHARQRPLRLRR